MTLATRVFQNDEYVTKINLPPLLQEIQERAFENCVHLKEIVFPKTLQTINKYAFNGNVPCRYYEINFDCFNPYDYADENEALKNAIEWLKEEASKFQEQLKEVLK